MEVTKLSLLLKVLEGETGESLNTQLSLIQERALPDLSANIRCGNALVSSDFPGIADLFNDPAKARRIRPFDWAREFPDVFRTSSNTQSSGFDAIIGNPPYVRQESLGDYKEYFKTKYPGVFAGTADLYTYFIERSMGLLKPGGHYGINVANKWMRAGYGENLRKWIKNQSVTEIIDFGDLPVFENATTYPMILRMEKAAPKKEFRAVNIKSLEFDSLAAEVKRHSFAIELQSLNDGGWSLVNKKSAALFDKIKSAGVPLGEYVENKIYRGVLTGLNEAFVIDSETRERLIAEDPKSAEIIKPFLAGRDIKRYEKPAANKYLIFARRGIKIKEFPAILNHLTQYKVQLKPKPKDWPAGKEWKGRKPGSYEWYELQDSIDYYEEFNKPKFMLPDISLRGNFAVDPYGGMYCVNTAYILISAENYLLGILNCRLITFFYSNLSSAYRGGYLRFIFQYLIQLPIHRIDQNSPHEVALKSEIEKNVKSIMDLMERRKSARTGRDAEDLERMIAGVDGPLRASLCPL